ncbi:hypothetical protein BV22DRAFT_992387, partial [Leucogyrophana mollusca]
FTRHKDPFNDARVAYIKAQVTIGQGDPSNLSPEERKCGEDLVAEYADIFACSLLEVKQVPGAQHKLNIPPDAKFNLRVHQRALSPPQMKFYHGKVNEMHKADLIERTGPADVKAVAPTVLAQKAH